MTRNPQNPKKQAEGQYRTLEQKQGQKTKKNTNRANRGEGGNQRSETQPPAERTSAPDRRRAGQSL